MRRIFAVVLSAFLGCVTLLSVAPTAQTAERVPTLVDGFRACIAGGGSADLLLLIDESSSLQISDPGDARVESASYLLSQLATYADGAPNKLNVAISTFASDYSDLYDWTELNSGTLPGLQGSINSLKSKVNGLETDYWSALDGARGALADRAKGADGTGSCQAVVWFTDGGLDYEVRTTEESKKAFGNEKVFAPGVELTSEERIEEVRKAAVQDICRSGGIADQMRSSDIALFGIGLKGSTAQQSDFSFMRTVTTGKDGDSTCGKLSDPVPGEFHLATDIDSLLFAFDGMSSVGGDPLVQEKGICQKVECTEEAHTFVLDRSTPSVQVLASADAPSLMATVVSPSGKKFELSRGSIGSPTTAKIGSSTVSYTWLSEETYSLSLTMGQNDKDWSGPWSLLFTDPVGETADKVSKTSVRIIGSLKPSLLNSKDLEWRVGETLAGVTLGLVDHTGKTVDPKSLLGRAALTATVTSSDGQRLEFARDLDKASISKPLDLDLSEFPVGAAELSMELTITTAASTSGGKTTPGTVLEPAAVAVPLMLLAPSEFPVLPPKIDFGKTEGKPEMTVAIPLSGSGCVWLADSAPEIVASPESMGTIGITSPASSGSSCVAAENGTLDLTLTADDAGNGTINGKTVVMIAPEGEPDKAMPVQMDFTASVSRPLNTTNFILALLVALLLGPGIPLLILYLAKRFVSKIPGQPLSSQLIQISVENNQVLRDGRPFELNPTDLTNLVSIDSSGTRNMSIAGVEFKVRTGWSPMGSGYVTADWPGRSGASSAHPATDKTGTTARLPLAIHNHWLVFTAAGMGRQNASVLILTNGEASPEDKRTLQEDLNRRLPDLLARLNDRLGQDTGGTTEATSTFGGLGQESASVGAFQGFGDSSYSNGEMTIPPMQIASDRVPPFPGFANPSSSANSSPSPSAAAETSADGQSSGSLFGWGESDPPAGPSQ